MLLMIDNYDSFTYNHAQYLAERTRMMQDWADYVYSLKEGSGKVVPIKYASTRR